jgi:hypothetical protein
VTFIFYGVQANVTPVTSSCVMLTPAIVLGNQQAVVCWRDKDGLWHLEDVLGCNSATDPDDPMLILGADGDDVVMPVIHRATNEEFVCPIPGTSGQLYSVYATPSFGVLEWYGRSDTYSPRYGGSGCWRPEGCSYMPMGVAIHGGLGEDEIHGAPGDDQVISSNGFGDPWCLPHGGRGSGDTTIDACVCASDISCCNSNWDWDCVQLASTCGADCSGLTSFEADDAQDIVCGHGGTDTVIGDEDPDPFNFELLSGGPGANDFCRGIGVPGSPCCDPVMAPGCADATIEAAVCAYDPYCCSTYWDALCTQHIEPLGVGTCPNRLPPCCTMTSSPGCGDDVMIESAVCAADAYCCTTAWDSLCVGEVESVAGGSCDPISDVATSTCEVMLEVTETDTGDGVIARSVCADDHPESLPARPPGSAPVHTTYRVASDFIPPSCF